MISSCTGGPAIINIYGRAGEEKKKKNNSIIPPVIIPAVAVITISIKISYICYVIEKKKKVRYRFDRYLVVGR